MTILHTTRHAADALGISVQRVKQLVVQIGVGQKVGRDWVLSDDDLERLRHRNRKPGRPGRQLSTGKPTPPD